MAATNSSTRLVTRRQALKNTALVAMGAPLLQGLVGCSSPGGGHRLTLNLGLASYSLAKSSVDEVIAALKQLQITNVSLYRSHCPWAGTKEECHAVAQKFKAAGVRVTGTGVVELPNDEAAVRKAFENARATGIPTMTCKPAMDAFPLVERFVKEYDLKLAIHNHGPEDKVYPSPFDAWKAIQPYDKRIGLCIDVGHAARAGVDPAEAIRKCASRLYDVHLKDSMAPVGAQRDVPAEVGQGRLNIKGILSALVEIRYSHVVGFEYEKHDSDVMPGLSRSVAFVRKTLAELAV